jgi:murein DD-endopeptidase MepM/ murein hydrolase activator NlpD
MLLCSLFTLGFAGGAGSIVTLLRFQFESDLGPGATPHRGISQVVDAVPPLRLVAAAPSSPLGLEGRSTRPAALAPLPAATLGTEHAVSAHAGKAKAVPPPEGPPDLVPVVVRRGDTLMEILLANGIEPTDAHAAIAALVDVYDPRKLRTGQQVRITPLPAAGPRRLSELSFSLGPLQAIEVLRNEDGGFRSRKVDRPQRRVLVHEGATIRDSLYLTAARASLPPPLTAELIKLFSWDVDFQRDIHAGNTIEVLYEQVVLEDDAREIVPGDILYARLGLSTRGIDAYRFEQPDGTVNYFDRSGRSLRKSLLRTPVDGARVSSRFGMRKHPILGYSRMHKGIDFAAPPGTPIFAAGGGRVEAAGRNGGYGNYVRIRHNGAYATAYAHMSRIADGIRDDAQVSQGQIIGYVGSTGSSTGPHLHYEIIYQGEQVNPLSVRQAALDQLQGEQLASFQREVARIDQLRSRTQEPPTQLAARLD